VPRPRSLQGVGPGLDPIELDGDGARLAAERVVRVETEVEQQLMQLALVAANRQHLRRRLGDDRGRGRQRRPQEVVARRHHRREIEDVLLDFVRPSKSEQLIDQVPPALADLQDPAGELVRLRVRRQILRQKLGEPQLGSEQIVEVVRDAAGQPADRLHLGRLLQSHQHVLALALLHLSAGDVLQCHDEARHRAVPAARRRNRRVGPEWLGGGPLRGHLRASHFALPRPR
jgi:hypothetical protein